MKLYELTDAFNQIKDLIEDGEADYMDTLESLEFEIEEKADNIARILSELQGSADVLKKEEERLYGKRKALENNVKNLKIYLEDQMKFTGKTKFKTELFNFNIQKNAPSLDVTSEENIPEEFYVIERKLQRSELLKAIKAGAEIDGVELKQSESLRIR